MRTTEDKARRIITTEDEVRKVLVMARNYGIKIGLVIGLIVGIVIGILCNIGWNKWKESVSNVHYGHEEIVGLNPIYHDLRYGNFGDPKIEEFYEYEWVWDCTKWCNGNHENAEKVER